MKIVVLLAIEGYFMARPKVWIPRIAPILAHLEADTAERYRRTEIERIFSISASAAKELMGTAGAREAKPGMELTITRAKLLDYVRYSPDGQAAITELARRKKVAVTLRAADEELKIHHTRLKLRVTKEAEWSRFSDLPNVAIQPGMMQVTFTPGDSTDLLDTLYRFVKAVANEEDAFERMCAPIQRRA